MSCLPLCLSKQYPKGPPVAGGANGLADQPFLPIARAGVKRGVDQTAVAEKGGRERSVLKVLEYFSLYKLTYIDV